MALVVHALDNIGIVHDVSKVHGVDEESTLSTILGKDVKKRSGVVVWAIVKGDSNGTLNSTFLNDGSEWDSARHGGDACWYSSWDTGAGRSYSRISSWRH